VSVQQATVLVDVHVLIRQKPGQQLELCKRLWSPDVLANHIAAFAHAEGGTIVIGYDARRRRVCGCRRHRVESVMRQALERLGHTDLAKLEFHEVNGKHLAVIHVPRLDTLVCAPRGLIVRDGVAVKAMRTSVIEERIRKSKDRLSLSDYATIISVLNAKVEEQAREAEKERTIVAQVRSHLFGWAVCAGAGSLFTLLLQYVASFSGR